MWAFAFPVDIFKHVKLKIGFLRCRWYLSVPGSSRHCHNSWRSVFGQLVPILFQFSLGWLILIIIRKQGTRLSLKISLSSYLLPCNTIPVSFVETLIHNMLEVLRKLDPLVRDSVSFSNCCWQLCGRVSLCPSEIIYWPLECLSIIIKQ